MATVLEKKPDHVPAELVFDFDIYNDIRLDVDTQATYRDALENAPDIFWTPRNGGHWMVRRYKEISEIVQEPAVFSTREMQIPRVPGAMVQIPLNLDPPENIPYRQALMPKFSPKAVREMEEKIKQWATRIVGDVADKGECEFVNDVSSLFPVSIFMELMGFPLDRLRWCRDVSDNFFKAQGNMELLFKYAAEISGFIEEQIDAKLANPDDKLLSHILTADLGGRPFTRDEVHRTCFLLFLGGMDTVTNTASFAYQNLAQRPDLQKRLADDPTLIPKFVDEALRCYGPVATPRLVVQDAERFGVTFREGEMVLCLLYLAGRDERVNPNPQAFDIDRSSFPHLTFSTGPHLCLGHNLARMELRLLTEEWVRRIPSFRLKPDEKRHFRATTVLALENLALVWDK